MDEKSPAMMRWLLVLLALVLLQSPNAHAHVGSPDVFSDGQVGPYPAHIAIRMPPVVPGRARIEVRSSTGQPLTVSFLPLYARTAVKNAPPAETAQPVTGDPGLYSGELWLMSVGAYSIEVRVAGASGAGVIQIPVNSVATHQLPLSPFLRNLLLGLGALLSVGFLAIVYASVGESVLGPGAAIQKAERRRGLVASAIAAVVVALLLAGGWHWWMADEQAFRRNLREGAWPDLAATVETTGHQRVLRLTLGEKAFKPDYALPLLSDHGKLLHLFLIREPAHDVFAHLHPIRRGGKAFDLVLPELPGGTYKVLCDLTLSDSGISSTASGTVQIPSLPVATVPAASGTHGLSLLPDPDDSWFQSAADARPSGSTGETSFTLPGGATVVWKAHPPLRTNQDAHLEFIFCDATGRPLPLQPYMGMMSHAAILRADGKVFDHLHPTGNFSMAAQSFFDAKIAREASGNASGGTMPEMDHSKMHHGAPNTSTESSITLPYEFPSPGDYQIWVQIKTGGQIQTATFTTTVAP
jgi:hypothetical protein